MSYREVPTETLYQRIAVLEKENNDLKSKNHSSKSFFKVNNIILYVVLAICISVSTIFLGSAQTIGLIIRIILNVLRGTGLFFRLFGKLLFPLFTLLIVGIILYTMIKKNKNK